MKDVLISSTSQRQLRTLSDRTHSEGSTVITSIPTDRFGTCMTSVVIDEFIINLLK